MMVFDRQDYLKSWVSSHVGGIDLGVGAAIGVEKKGIIVAAVYFNNFRVSPKKEPISIEANVVVIDRTAINRHTLRVFFEYAFIQLRVKRLSSTVAKSNKRTRRLLQRLGLKYEGVLRKAWHHGEDCAVYSMLRHECRWI